MTADELLFFDRLPRFLPVYAALKEMLAARYPEMTVRASKTQISFRSRYGFALVSLPYRRKKEWPKEYLLVSFGLPAQKHSPRIAAYDGGLSRPLDPPCAGGAAGGPGRGAAGVD
jgi:hypothetical protein